MIHILAGTECNKILLYAAQPKRIRRMTRRKPDLHNRTDFTFSDSGHT